MTFVACAALLTSMVLVTSCNKSDQNDPNEVVKTEFAISLPPQAAGSGPNKMPGATVQIQSGLLNFMGIKGLTLVPFAKQGEIGGVDNRLGSNIELGAIPAGASLYTNSKAKLYTDVEIPLTTASFLVYGESATAGTNFQKGSLTAKNLTNNTPADFEFDLEPVLGTTTLGQVTTSGKGLLLLNYLNSLMDAVDDGDTEWRNISSSDDAGMAAMYAAYTQMHALSSFEVARVMSDLYNSLLPLTSTLANNVKLAIADDQYVTIEGTSAPYTIVLKSGLQGFPANLNLPDGAVRIKYNTTSKVFEGCSVAEYTTASNTPLDMYTYPASLWYYANSQIKTANTSKATLYNNTNYWNDILNGYTDAAAVNSLTRSVAIEDTIQYGVARLDVKVKLKSNSLQDAVGTAIVHEGYTVTGILIGNQRNVGFNFAPKDETAGATKYTIYDNIMTNAMTASASAFSNANSTLVLQSPKLGEATNDDVQIAVEFVNNSGHDFIGADGGVVPNNGKFYLVAKLTASAATETGSRVFMQDYTTTANLTINSLANAYNTIPDLRTPELELGMAVSLTWESGHVYDIEIP